MPIVNCNNCRELFYARPAFLKVGWGKFCSRQCHYIAARRGKIVACDVCGKESYRAIIKLQRSKSGKFFCSKSCQTKWRNTLYVGNKHLLWKDGSSTYRNLLLKSGRTQKCVRCHKRDIRVLVAHHIDENRKNYKLENLVWLCNNCHYLVHKYNEALFR